MKILNYPALQSADLLMFNLINTIMITSVLLFVTSEAGASDSVTLVAKAVTTNQVIQGQSGGSIDSKGCGFIGNVPNHVMNIDQRIDYMRLTVQASGGQPTLLVLGPNSGDSFCVLGDEISGLKPEISGVWEAGKYQIYVGDRLGNKHQFTLDISTGN
jgi:hypothetical protein